MTSMWRSKPSAAVVIMSLSAFVCVSDAILHGSLVLYMPALTMRRFSLILMCLLFSSVSLFAQGALTTVTGTVCDSVGTLDGASVFFDTRP